MKQQERINFRLKMVVNYAWEQRLMRAGIIQAIADRETAVRSKGASSRAGSHPDELEL